MTKDPRINIAYDFEGDDDDIEEYERSLRDLYSDDESPFFDTEEEYDKADYDDDDHSLPCWIDGGHPCFFIDGKKY